jgi:hypothetical protein
VNCIFSYHRTSHSLIFCRLLFTPKRFIDLMSCWQSNLAPTTSADCIHPNQQNCRLLRLVVQCLRLTWNNLVSNRFFAWQLVQLICLIIWNLLSIWWPNPVPD